MKTCINTKCPAYNIKFVYDCELNVIADGNCKEYIPEVLTNNNQATKDIPK